MSSSPTLGFSGAPRESQSKPSIALKSVSSNNYSKSKKRRLRRKKQLTRSVKREEGSCMVQSPVEAHPSPERASVSVSRLTPKSPGVQPECKDYLILALAIYHVQSPPLGTFEGFEYQTEMVTVDLSNAVIVDSTNAYYQELE